MRLLFILVCVMSPISCLGTTDRPGADVLPANAVKSVAGESDIDLSVAMIAHAMVLSPVRQSDVDMVRKSADSLRCYILHQNASREDREGWVQPDMDVYDASSDPCALMPGFVEPDGDHRREERHLLMRQQAEFASLH